MDSKEYGILSRPDLGLASIICVLYHPYMKGSTAGIVMALGSNVLFALRNVKTKYAASEDQINLTSIPGFSLLSLTGFFCLLPTYFITSIHGGFPKDFQQHLINSHFLFLSSVCHVVYNAVSLTVVLSMFNPLQHAFLNIAKRVSIVLVFYIFVQQKVWLYFNS